MILYLSVIGIAVVLVCTFDILVMCPIMNVSPWFFVLAVLASTVYQVAVDGLFAFICERIPAKWVKDKKFFEVSKREQRFYEKLGIKKWKDKVLELGSLGGFSKSKIDDPNNPEYAEKFLIESYKGEVDHIIGMIMGFTVIFIFPLKFAWMVGVPVAIVNVFLNLLSTMILRYNTPKLKILHKRALRNKEKELSEKTKDSAIEDVKSEAEEEVVSEINDEDAEIENKQTNKNSKKEEN